MRRKRFNDDDLEKSMNAVGEGKTTMYAASKEYKIPGTTLRDHMSEKVQHTQMGPAKSLSLEEESFLG